MARRRASMREGPLAELFRATEAAQRQAERKRKGEGPAIDDPPPPPAEPTPDPMPEPVPPPSPAVTKTMSEPRSACLIWSCDSSAATRPTSGSAPEPRPCVSSRPMWIFTGDSLICSCWTSVFTATNSTWPSPASTMRLIAFRPAPPTPTTRITAR